MKQIVTDHELNDVSIGTISVIKASVDYHADQAKQQYNDVNHYMIKSLLFISFVPVIVDFIGDLIHIPND